MPTEWWDERGEITLYIATSVDGFVADEDGGVAWLDGFDAADGSYEGFLAGVDRLVVGSRAYEQVLGFGEWPCGERPTTVLARRDLPLAADTVELVDGPVDDLVERLRGGTTTSGAAAARGRHGRSCARTGSTNSG